MGDAILGILFFVAKTLLSFNALSLDFKYTLLRAAVGKWFVILELFTFSPFLDDEELDEDDNEDDDSPTPESIDEGFGITFAA